jgi:hypothetical protein
MPLTSIKWRPFANLQTQPAPPEFLAIAKGNVVASGGTLPDAPKDAEMFEKHRRAQNCVRERDTASAAKFGSTLRSRYGLLLSSRGSRRRRGGRPEIGVSAREGFDHQSRLAGGFPGRLVWPFAPNR